MPFPENTFPNLGSSGYIITSPQSITYNCIAWAANIDYQWWWPDRDYLCYWPDQVPREEKLEAFIKAFQKLGYSLCSEGSLEPGFEKIAVYADPSGRPTHAARQLRSGKWTSKLGYDIDIEHAVDGLTGTEYGNFIQFMKRPRQE
jgi:hypothetical protein